MKKIALLLLVTMMIGCGTITEDNYRTSPSKNHKLCGIDKSTAILDGVWLFFGIMPGLTALAVDSITGALWYSDRECDARLE